MLEPFVITPNLKFLAQEPVYFYPSLLYLFLYWFPPRTEHELATWVTLSTFSLQSLHRGDTYWQSMVFLAAFGLSACSWAAHIRVSISCFNSVAFSRWHFLWPCIHSVSFRNWSCNVSFLHAAFLSFFRSPLFFPSIFALSWSLQLQSLEVSRCYLQYNQKEQIFPVQHSLWHSAALYLAEYIQPVNRRAWV